MSYYVYTAGNGESYADIAEKFGCDIKDIEKLNCTAVGQLSHGSLVRVPVKGCPKGVFHSLSANETLRDVSKKYGIGLNALLLANPYLDPFSYIPGQVIIIPLNKEIPEPPADSYTVSRSYSLDYVLNRFHVKVSELQKLNPGINLINPKIGTVLKLK